MAKKAKAAPKKTPKAPKAKAAKKVEEQPVQQEPAKTKPIVKAKKYKAKTADELARIQRSKVQRIYLIQATRNQGSWNFTVQGTTGSHYYVRTSTEVSCTCMDFRMKRKPCKHIYFIITQVGQNQALLDYFKSGDKKISKNAYKILDDQLSERLKARLEKPGKQTKEIDLKDDPTCIICFMDMDKDTEKLDDCGACKRFFHAECITAWKQQSNDCPLCRRPLTSVAAGTGALGKLQAIKL